MATHAPITGAQTRAPAMQMDRHRRRAIETQIAGHLQRVELLIARLDRADALFEDLEEDDHSGSYIDDGEAEGDHGRGLLKALPIYSDDQRRGPVNYRHESADHHAEQCGYVRTPSGRWRRPT